MFREADLDKLSFELTVNNSFLSNEITFLAPGIDFFSTGSYRGITPIRNSVGNPISSFFGYQSRCWKGV